MNGPIEDGMEALSIPDCEQRLSRGGVGTLALCGVEAPVLRPVNFAVHQGWIIIRTGEGQIFDAATRSEPASFVISDLDRLEHSGWSVVVSGSLAELSSLGFTESIPLRPWAKADKNQFVGLCIDQISGRSIAKDSGEP